MAPSTKACAAAAVTLSLFAAAGAASAEANGTAAYLKTYTSYSSMRPGYNWYFYDLNITSLVQCDALYQYGFGSSKVMCIGAAGGAWLYADAYTDVLNISAARASYTASNLTCTAGTDTFELMYPVFVDFFQGVTSGNVMETAEAVAGVCATFSEANAGRAQHGLLRH